jgi:hypothetical protein
MKFVSIALLLCFLGIAAAHDADGNSTSHESGSNTTSSSSKDSGSKSSSSSGSKSSSSSKDKSSSGSGSGSKDKSSSGSKDKSSGSKDKSSSSEDKKSSSSKDKKSSSSKEKDISYNMYSPSYNKKIGGGAAKSKQVGVTTPKGNPVEVKEQKDKEVTFEVTNKWNATVDYLFVQYSDPSSGYPKCEVFKGVTPDFGTDIDSACMRNIPISVVTLFAVSTAKALSDGDSAALPSCCGDNGDTDVLAGLEGGYQSASYTYILDCAPGYSTSSYGGFAALEDEKSSSSKSSPSSSSSKDHSSKDHSSKDHSSKDHSSKDHSSKDHSSKDHSSKDHKIAGTNSTSSGSKDKSSGKSSSKDKSSGKSSSSSSKDKSSGSSSKDKSSGKSSSGSKDGGSNSTSSGSKDKSSSSSSSSSKSSSSSSKDKSSSSIEDPEDELD